jgi:hypothetical protein
MDLISTTASAFSLWDRFGSRIKFAYNKYTQKDLGTFIFDKYMKEVKVLANGNGISITKIYINVLDLDNFEIIDRQLNIEDADKRTIFQKTLKELMTTNKSQRYIEQGFWHDNTDAVEISNYRRYKLHRELSWDFKVDTTQLQSNKIHLCYAFSLPKMYPIKNGIWDEQNAPLDTTNVLSTSLQVEHAIKDFTYKLSLDKNISLILKPKLSIIPGGSKAPTKEKNVNPVESDIFFNKYSFNVPGPERLSKIQFSFCLNNQ